MAIAPLLLLTWAVSAVAMTLAFVAARRTGKIGYVDVAWAALMAHIQRRAKDRWRAHIVRIPGVPTALMPFYGPTPIEAARQLCDWLTRAHARASTPTGQAGSV